MASFESATLWQNSLGKKTNEDEHEKGREYFRTSLESFRRKAIVLAGEISNSMPDYTVHDITHIDALWEMASIICGEDYELNPAEAYVLGGAFLIHDLGMGLAAYPDGIDSIKNSTIWSDTFAYLSKDTNESKEAIEKKTLDIVLRALHAKQAEKLALISWGGDSNREYLIDDTALREDYGSVIGNIAYSHWWDSSDITVRFPAKLGAIGSMPHSWQVDPVKLACIMRVADAAHIDSRRAPSFLRKLRNLPKLSEQHWLFQQKLYQPRIERDRLVYTSKSSFDVEEAASWWLCYDTLKMIDKELYSVDSILNNSGVKRFKAKGLANIDNLSSLVRLITTNGWTPVDANVHVGNVSKLVKNLGGSQLYGNNPFVAIRELIQNGCDAIRARRVLEGDDSNYGQLIVRLDKDESGLFIEIDDNGVGMSAAVLTGPFLDFGNSLWGTTLMHDQFPGLETKGFSSTGKFGVGFFSAFMISNKIKITTRRYEEGRSETRVLSFENELLERPILRVAYQSEYIRNGGTQVRLYLESESFLKKLLDNRLGGNFKDIKELLAHHFPTLDVSLFLEDKLSGVSEKIVSANDWKYLNGADFLDGVLSKIEGDEVSDLKYMEKKKLCLEFAENMRAIYHQGHMVGRGFLVPGNEEFYIEDLLKAPITVGGFRTSSIRGCVGAFLGSASSASRNSAYPAFPSELYREWLHEQYTLIKDRISDKEQVKLASKMRLAGLDIEELFFCSNSSKYFNQVTIVEEILKKYDVIKFVSSFSLKKQGHEDFDDYYSVIYDPNVICIETGIPMILMQSDSDYLSWPNKDPLNFDKQSLSGLLNEKISQAWNIPIEKLAKSNKRSKPSRSKERVGMYLGKEFLLEVGVIKKSDFAD